MGLIQSPLEAVNHDYNVQSHQQLPNSPQWGMPGPSNVSSSQSLSFNPPSSLQQSLIFSPGLQEQLFPSYSQVASHYHSRKSSHQTLPEAAPSQQSLSNNQTNRDFIK